MLNPGTKLGHYEIVAPLGSGGMGEVYRAHDERLERDVAVKILPSGMLSDEDSRRRFRKEALVLSKLNHPNVAIVHDFDSAEGVDFLVMEFIAGQTLAQRIISGPLAEKETLRLGVQMADGLAAAHAQGIVHGDLKPRNLVVTPEGRLKILDFGLARQFRLGSDADATHTVTEKRVVAGTVPYMSPEQLSGEQLDARTDIYSAGAVLYEMATARRPFDDDSSTRQIDAILHQPPVTPRALNARISPELERIILKCLDKTPERRYQSARELQVDLERLATPSSVTATPAPPAQKLPRVLLFAGLGLAALLAALFVWRGVARKASPPTATTKETTIAVLPFQNLSSDPKIDFLRLALPDEIVTTLSYVPSVAIRPSAATQKYASAAVDPQQAGRELRVEDVVTGHYQEEGDHLRVTVEAVRVEEDSLVWQETIRVPHADLVRLQEQISGRIRQGLVPLLGAVAAARGSQPKNSQAYDLYLRSVAISHDPVPNKEAISMLERAVGLDPGYGPAWEALGRRYDYDAEYADGGEAAYKRAESANQRALTLDPDFAQPASNLILLEADDQQLESAYDRARDLLQRRPDSATAHFSMSYVLRYAGLLEEAARECDAAFARDSTDYTFRSCALVFMLLGQYDRARQFIQIDAGSLWAKSSSFDLLLREKNYDEARKLLVQNAHTTWYDYFVTEGCLTHATTAEGRQLALKSQQETLGQRDPEPMYFNGSTISNCGYPDLGIVLLRAAVEHNYCSYPAMDNDPFFASVRGTSEFAAIRAEGIACQQRFLAHRSQLPTATAAPPDQEAEPLLALLRSNPRFQDLLRRVGLPP